MASNSVSPDPQTRAISLLLVAVVGGFPLAAAPTPALDTVAMRELLALPKLTGELKLGFTFSAVYGVRWDDGSDPQARIEALQRELEDDATDGARWLRLASLHGKASNWEQKKDAYAKALALYRQQYKLTPSDPLVVAGYVEALLGTDDDEAAEQVARQAVRQLPRAWQCPASLARVLESKAWSVLIPEGRQAQNEGDQLAKLAAVLGGKGASSEVRRQVEAILDEAAECRDAAVELAPDLAQVYQARFGFRAMRALLLGWLLNGVGWQFSPAQFAAPENLADLRRAAELTPDDYRTVALWIVFAQLTSAASDGATPGPQPLQIKEACAKLEQIAKSPDPQTGVGALLTLTVIEWMMLEDDSHVEQRLRQILATDPAREVAWDMLHSYLTTAGRHEENLKLCQQRLQLQDSPRNRLALAKGYDAVNQYPQAEEHARAALDQDPNYFLAHLALAVLILKQGDDETHRKSAAESLAGAERCLPKGIGKPEKAHFLAMRGVHAALSGDLSRARKLFAQSLEADDDCEAAKRGKELVESASPPAKP